MVNVEGSLSADLIAQQNFGPARRGFDPDEVRAFLVKVAAEIVALHDRQAALEDARRDAEYRAAHPSFDEETLIGAVGDETAHILKSAHDAAGDIKSRAEENASRILKEAHQQAEVLRGQAETVLARRTDEAEGVAARIKETAKNEAERLLDQARQQTKAMRAQAEAERNAMIEGAQATREKILAALSKKRNVAVAQVEQLRAGRERLLSSYEVVRRTLEEATADLARAEVEARAAADAVRHRPLALDEPDGLEDDNEPTNPTLPIIQKRLRPAGTNPSEPPPLARQPNAASGSTPPAEGTPITVTSAASEDSKAASPASDASAPTVKLSAPSPAAPTPEAPRVSGTDSAPATSAAASPPAIAAAKAATSASSPASRVHTANGSTSTAPPASPVPVETTSTSSTPPPPHPPPAPDESAATASASTSAVPPALPASPVAPASPPPAAPATDIPAAATTPASPGNVESLFARIRADRDKAVAHAREVLAEERPIPDGDEALLQRRDEITGPLEANLTRRLKRALQDDQNDLLDRLRGLRSSQKAASVVLPATDTHAARFREAGRPFLSEAVTAGVAFTTLLTPGLKTSEHLGGVDQATEDLAEAIVDPLRRRLESVLAEGEGNDPVVLAEAVGGAYREWKTKRVEVVAADHIAAAFSAGAYAATPAATPLRWLVEDTDGPCPDCDDNALAGAQPRGEPFPTGQRHPPAHPGCRCLLIPQPT
jgi:DivIVA domain-containing protein